jgi:hypothetical protein
MVANTLANNASGNYTLIQPTGFSANITPRNITIAAVGNQSKIYGNADALLNYSITSGTLALVNSVSDVLGGTLSRDAGENVGNNYGINQGSITNITNPNYNIIFVGSTYEITKRAITLAATPVTSLLWNLDCCAR